ncbi:DUF805 domain-containing protein [Aquibacillus sediminis]|uniref:DUF805 domain-containing protein n=1 Tax=Aquibacillus sediminis TaxID=2574734 RepID=UPI001109212D|nr:DUF805 domain-containing protein [Aquibacillus sediminis]
MQWYLKVIKNYAEFGGRARRTEYWMFTLVNAVIVFLLSMLESIAGIMGIVTFLYSLAVLIPSLAVVVRRLHDSGRTGWWILVSLIPIVGGIVILVFMCLDSEQGDNEYGPNPKFEGEW